MLVLTAKRLKGKKMFFGGKVVDAKLLFLVSS